ncbi:hypothetical protein DM860_001014 [Cuscuta australis]|uniref:Uncharacterized protein n=1 Tax=Cuscuta australis TaxID=267555 RepID=A0A328DSS4_9ASTE|nr:hypothetical protein DM860_001014 [Cuscuta australis]
MEKISAACALNWNVELEKALDPEKRGTNGITNASLMCVRIELVKLHMILS